MVCSRLCALIIWCPGGVVEDPFHVAPTAASSLGRWRESFGLSGQAMSQHVSNLHRLLSLPSHVMSFILRCRSLGSCSPQFIGSQSDVLLTPCRRSRTTFAAKRYGYRFIGTHRGLQVHRLDVRRTIFCGSVDLPLCLVCFCFQLALSERRGQQVMVALRIADYYRTEGQTILKV